jgi:hypothetical protein
MILITVLLLLALLVAAGMGAALSVQNDFRMTANFRGGTAGSYLADAGIEWGKQQIAATTTMPPTVFDEKLPLGPGTFAVTFLSSRQTTPLSASVLLRSAGEAYGTSQIVEARITKRYDLVDAAVALRGNSRAVHFGAGPFSISGYDHDLVSGAPLTASRPRAGISVGGTAVLNQTAGALAQVHGRNLSGDNGDGAAITVSPYIPGDQVARLAHDLCAAPHAFGSNVSPGGNLTFLDETWGERSALQLRCVNGLPGSGDSVVFSGSSGGAGVLVVRDAELVLTGHFRWEGLVIVSGGDVGFRVEDPANKDIFGAVIVHESGNAIGSGPRLLDVQGLLHVRYSRDALSRAATLIPTPSLTASYGFLPVTLSHDHRRFVSP